MSKTTWKGRVRYTSNEPLDRIKIESKATGSRTVHYLRDVTTTEDCEVVLEVDVERLLDFMGRRAAHAQSGKSRIQGGIITARIKSRTVVDRDVRERPVPDWAKPVTG